MFESERVIGQLVTEVILGLRAVEICERIARKSREGARSRSRGSQSGSGPRVAVRIPRSRSQSRSRVLVRPVPVRVLGIPPPENDLAKNTPEFLGGATWSKISVTDCLETILQSGAEPLESRGFRARGQSWVGDSRPGSWVQGVRRAPGPSPGHSSGLNLEEILNGSREEVSSGGPPYILTSMFDSERVIGKPVTAVILGLLGPEICRNSGARASSVTGSRGSLERVGPPYGVPTTMFESDRIIGNLVTVVTVFFN